MCALKKNQNPFLFKIPHETDEFRKHPFRHVPKLFIYISNIKSEVKFKRIVIIVKQNPIRFYVEHSKFAN